MLVQILDLPEEEDESDEMAGAGLVKTEEIKIKHKSAVVKTSHRQVRVLVACRLPVAAH